MCPRSSQDESTTEPAVQDDASAAVNDPSGGCPIPHGQHDDEPRGHGRRSFLTAGLGTLGALGLASCTAANNSDGGYNHGDSNSDGAPSNVNPEGRRISFAGAHQNGIYSTPVGLEASLSAFRIVADTREECEEMFAALSVEVADLMEGRMPEVRPEAYPPLETGILGDQLEADSLGIVVSVGASLFDERYGLADKKPKELVKMPFLSNDRLDPERSHGDLLISIEANHVDTVHHALRQIMRAIRKYVVMIWTLDGYTRGSSGAGNNTPRNLLGFKDGTNNIAADSAKTMDDNVWVQEGDGEPAWAVGGTYHVVRVIRMLVEFWDRTQLAEQEAIFGRHKVSGAPLGKENEFDQVSFTNDAGEEIITMDAHIRRANPQTPESANDAMLRRGFSYSRGVDAVGQLDQGLAFVSYQRQLQRFLNVQERLNGEPLEEYIRPEGGGFYFAFPGVPDDGTSLAAKLFAP